jgi:uncharacterized membrane protein
MVNRAHTGKLLFLKYCVIASPRLYRIAQRVSLRDGRLILQAPIGGLPESSSSAAASAGRRRDPFVSHWKILEKAMTNRNSVVAIYDTHEQAEQAVKSLQEAGVDMKSLSIAGKDQHTDEHVVGYYNTGDRMKYWGKMGAFWGGFWGLLFGSALFAIPGIGPVLVAGPLVAWIVAGLEGAVLVGGAGAIGGALASIGIPKDSIVEYELALKTDKYMLIVHGSTDEVAKAKDILDGTKHSFCALHEEPVLAK